MGAPNVENEYCVTNNKRWYVRLCDPKSRRLEHHGGTQTQAERMEKRNVRCDETDRDLECTPHKSTFNRHGFRTSWQIDA